ncbi:hypothetical protein JCM10207_006190 [Rhodosporidiobolus poonsookiae]
MSKRPLPFSGTNEPASKRAPPASGTLSSFFPTTHRPAPPSPLLASDPISDRASTFIAHAAPCTTSHAALALQSHVRALRGPTHPVECSHEVLAYRILAPKPGKSGLEGADDWAAKEAGDDDGEKGAWGVVRDVLREEGAVDVGVVVSRLYGGQMLGPARFAHIRTVATQAIQRLAAAQALPLLLERLEALDAEIAALSAPVSAADRAREREKEREKTEQQYKGLDVQKAERLVAAREKRVELLRKQKEKREAEAAAAEAEVAKEPEDGDDEQRREEKELYELVRREERERRAREGGGSGSGAEAEAEEEGA